MAKIKHTKTELKAQREDLERFERFLPMLILKKQQLQAEIQVIKARMAENGEKIDKLRGGMDKWIKLLGEPVGLEDYTYIEEIKTSEHNIAGVNIPVLENVKLQQSEQNLFDTPPWIDDAIDVFGELLTMHVEQEILKKQKELIAEELRTTSQRVNLFEKVKIPECNENIRVIKIFLGDEQTAAVARGKLAKKRSKKAAPILEPAA